MNDRHHQHLISSSDRRQCSAAADTTVRVIASRSDGNIHRFDSINMSHLRGREASSRQTLNVESYIRIDIQHHGLAHEGNKD